MILSKKGSIFINELYTKTGIYEDFRKDIKNRDEHVSIKPDILRKRVFFPIKTNLYWEFNDKFFKVENNILNILPSKGLSREFYTWIGFDTGFWEIRVKVDEIILENDCRFYFLYEDFNNCYFIKLGVNNNLTLVKNENGFSENIIISNFNLVKDIWYKIKISKDVSGNFELFVNNESKGNILNSFLPIQKHFRIEQLSEVKILVDYIKVI